MPPILEAVEAYATLGEGVDALRAVFGEYEPSTTFLTKEVNHENRPYRRRGDEHRTGGQALYRRVGLALHISRQIAAQA